MAARANCTSRACSALSWRSRRRRCHRRPLLEVSQSWWSRITRTCGSSRRRSRTVFRLTSFLHHRCRCGVSGLQAGTFRKSPRLTSCQTRLSTPMDYPIAIIFDVEGTLIDCASQTLECWRQVLGEFEHSFRRDELQPYSGMDSAEMLQCLLPKEPRERRQEMLKRHGDLYRERYLHSVRPFPAVFDTFKALAKRSVKVGIATTCTREELAIYDKQMRVLKFAAAIACGDDVQHGKPHPDLFRVVLRRRGVADRLRVLSVGDTPYDAKPAIELGLHAIGVLTG